MAAEGRLPIELLGGFLGSGKTTLLRRRYAGAAGERAAVIVNEFGEVPLDQRMALGTGSSIQVIAGGCVAATGATSWSGSCARWCRTGTAAWTSSGW